MQCMQHIHRIAQHDNKPCRGIELEDILNCDTGIQIGCGAFPESQGLVATSAEVHLEIISIAADSSVSRKVTAEIRRFLGIREADIRMLRQVVAQRGCAAFWSTDNKEIRFSGQGHLGNMVGLICSFFHV